MGTNDTSRSMFDPRKHYTGKWTLQGRLITDFDENDREAITAEERRRANLDIIGAYGSPDDGFRIANVRSENDSVEFDILAGSLYLGGLRLEQEELQTYRTQRDHLQAIKLPAGVQQPNQRDLVLLEAYEAPVTAVEDGELLDPAVGVDTSARSRRFQRVHVLTNVSAKNCDQAWKLLDARMQQTKTGKIGPDCRQVVDTRLTVTYTEDGVDDDLCEPPIAGGYLGAENQSIRVQLVDDESLTWGYDNASPLYRVSLSADRSEITLITPPRDLYSTPIVGQVVEILPWGAVLSNGEKAAGLSGHLTRITAVDPSDEAAGGAITITLDEPVPTAGFDEWKKRPDEAQLRANGTFYYMHIWNRGGDVTSAPAIPFTRGTPLTLGTTGIQITITGDDAVRDDHWIIAARPETPTQVLPWELEAAAAPTGYHRYYAPLALIRWKNNVTAEVTDCRPPFRPLTSRDGCCTYSVGDGKISDGDYNDLGEALAHLGANGGKICLLPGVHRADVVLKERSNITISGCGARSKLLPVEPEGGAVITLLDCFGIGLFNFEIVSVDGTGIAAERVDELKVEDLKVLAYKVGIDVDDSLDVSIRRCVIRMLDKEGGDVGIYAQGERVLIEDCDIQIVPGDELPEFPDDDDPDTPPVDPSDPCADPKDFYANLLYLVFYVDLIWGIFTYNAPPEKPVKTLGGIQIGSGSEDVIVRQNLISGGAGNGITLGSDIADVDLDDYDPLPGDDDEFPEVRMNHDYDYGYISGRLLLDDAPIGGMTIFFDNGNGGLFTFAVKEDGFFQGQLPPGEYVVTISDPLYGVVKVEPLGDGGYFVILKKRERLPEFPEGGEDLLAFIHEVTIEANRIANMGFSGIGAPRFTSSDEALRDLGFAIRNSTSRQLLYLVYIATGTITGFVVDLTIYRNTITRCLLNAALSNVDQFAIERALGGISLALCDGVNIEENVVQSCGRGAEMPVCGIFISFSIDVTIRENHILNNGQDRRAEQIVDGILAGPQSTLKGGPTQPSTFTTAESIQKMSLTNRNSAYINNQAAYERYRLSEATGNFAINVPDIDFQRGPRAGILLPLCLSTNIFAGASLRKATANLGAQGLTSAAEGRHAARIDGNYVIHPFGKTLFIGAAGTLSITDNQLISDRALPRELDALAGGLSGRIAAKFKLGDLDIFASNVMVVDICPGAYLLDAIRSPDNIRRDAVSTAFPMTPIPFGFPDGNVLFAGNQIKQGDAGARASMVTVFSMDDVNFVDNQIDVLNATDIQSTVVVFGVTTRAANNRMKEPYFLGMEDTPAGGLRGFGHYSLTEVSFAAGGMVNNQGHLCFQLVVPDPERGAEVANISLGGRMRNCDDIVIPWPDEVSLVILPLMQASVNFALNLSKAE
ncbi:MAG TPA: DUF6519 domain-containing protein [Herpetosiphonaceae bacterium]